MATTYDANGQPVPAATQPTGLINTAPAPAAPAQAPTAPTPWNVQPDQTVAGQVKKIIDTNSPLSQQAETRSLQQSNARGLLNSSMAVGAGQSALYDAVLPIAQADASVNANAGQFNANATNQFGLADKSIAANKEAAATNQGYTQSNMALGTTQDLTKMGVAQGYTQANAATQQGFTQANMGLQQGFDLTKMDKQAAATLTQMDKAQVLDLQKMATSQGYNLQTMNAAQILDLQKMTTAKQFDLEKMGAANGFTMDQMEQATVQDIKKMTAAQGMDLQKMAKDQGYKLDTMNKQQLIDLAKMDKTFTQQDREAQAKFGYDKELMTLQKDSNKEIASIEAQYKNLTQASASAASMSNTASANINAILLNEKLDAPSKQAAIDQVKTNYQNSLQLIGSMAGDVQLSSYMDTVLSDATFDGMSVAPPPPPPPPPAPAASNDGGKW